MNRVQPKPACLLPLSTRSKKILRGVVLLSFVLLLLIGGTALRPLGTTHVTHLQWTAASFNSEPQPTPVQTAEINEQTRSSNGLILASVVIVLIILGGTFGATRRKPQ